MDFSRHADTADDPLVLRKVTDEIMFALRRLSGQDYVDEYAKRKLAKEEPAEAIEPPRTPVLSGPPLPDEPSAAGRVAV
jgi:1-acyl-sn-glycerol-3-phosphate acyltransferase